MQLTMSIDLRHVEAIKGLLRRAAAENQQKLNDRLDQHTAKELGLCANTDPDQTIKLN